MVGIVGLDLSGAPSFTFFTPLIETMMIPGIFAYFSFCQIWWLIPMVIPFALVYAATRHEETAKIFAHAARVAFLTFFVMGVLLVLLYFLK